MLSAVRYIHSKGIVHRDLKLENFLFSTTTTDSELKMIDFGLSKHFTHGQQHNEAVGTPYTVAPEVIRGSYTEKCDVWAIGVITYLLLSGDPPFGGCGGPEPLTMVRQNILRGSYRFEPEEIWENVTPQAKQFIASLLVTNPLNRPSAEAAQQSAWLQEWANKSLDTNGGRSLNPNVVQALISFKEYSDMRKLLCEVLSFTLLPNQIEDLRREFEKFDTEGRGEITLASLKQVLMHSAGSRSLGSLSEGEVDDIFNAMRIRKTDTTIQWHEFIAAGLSQCDVDDRNLRLAFDRLDSDHKGYISFDDVLDLMGSAGTEEHIRAMFQDSLQLCRSKHARLSYEDFLHLMKGQTYEDAKIIKQSPVVHSPVISHRRGASLVNMDDVFSLGDSAIPANSTAHTFKVPVPFIPMLSTLSQVSEDLPYTTTLEVVLENEYFTDQDDRLPLEEKILIPTPSISSADTIPPPSVPSLDTTKVAKLLTRGRSKSYDEQDSHVVKGEHDEEEREKLDKLKGITDHRHAIYLPEHMPDSEVNEEVPLFDSAAQNIADQNKSALAANRELYRAHRRMRLAVLEASKRFEENRFLRTTTKLEQVSEDASETSVVSKQGVPARLMMKHGSMVRQDSGTVKELMQKKEMETEEYLRKANKMAGRGKKQRHKTVSDMSAMMAVVYQPETAKPIPDDNENEASLRNLSKNAMSWTGPPPSLTSIHRYDTEPTKSTVSEEKGSRENSYSNLVSCYSDMDLKKTGESDTLESSPIAASKGLL